MEPRAKSSFAVITFREPIERLQLAEDVLEMHGDRWPRWVSGMRSMVSAPKSKGGVLEKFAAQKDWTISYCDRTARGIDPLDGWDSIFDYSSEAQELICGSVLSRDCASFFAQEVKPLLNRCATKLHYGYCYEADDQNGLWYSMGMEYSGEQPTLDEYEEDGHWLRATVLSTRWAYLRNVYPINLISPELPSFNEVVNSFRRFGVHQLHNSSSVFCYLPNSNERALVRSELAAKNLLVAYHQVDTYSQIWPSTQGR